MNEAYRQLYYHLFGAMANAVEALENREPQSARQILIHAMREAEEKILSTEEKTETQ